jgi:hypothetical protein
MASGNIDSFDLKSIAKGGVIHEDVMNKIFDISKIPLPFTDLVGSTTHKNERFDWVIDELRAPDVTNARVDGSDAGTAGTAGGARVGNHSQISDEVIAVSYRADASDTIGRTKELAYRLTRGNQQIRRDVEAISLNNQASKAGTDSVAGVTGGLPSWIETTVMNADGSAATAGGHNMTTGLTAKVNVGDGSAAAGLSFQTVKDAIQGVYEEGGEVTHLMSNPGVIGSLSSYMFDNEARVATLTSDQGAPANSKATALSSVNVLVSDFGTIKLVPNRLQPLDANDNAIAFLLDPEYVSLSYLEGYRTDTLAKTGLSERRQISVDWGLRVHTEKAHGMIVNIDPAEEATA